MARKILKSKPRTRSVTRKKNSAASVSPSKKQSAGSVSPPVSRHVMNRLLAGGPLLGNRPKLIESSSSSSASSTGYNTSWDTFPPIITPELKCDHRKKPERYILLPHARYITVLAYQTGVKVATLIPSTEEENDNSENNIVIECVSLFKSHPHREESTTANALDRMEVDNVVPNRLVEETLLLVGCQDGSLREFSLQVLMNDQRSSTKAKGAADLEFYSISGPFFRPRRVIRLFDKKKQQHPIMHMTIPHLPMSQVGKDGNLVYVTIRRPEEKQEEESTKERQGSKSGPASFTVELVRILLPLFDKSKTTNLGSSSLSMRSIDKFKCKIRLTRKKKLISTLPFRMLSVAKDLPASNKQNSSILLVLARANSVSIYYDQLLDTATTTESSVVQPLSISMPSNNPLTAISISPNKADITCGHYCGNIRVINDILSDAEIYYNYGTAKAQTTLPKSAADDTYPDPKKDVIATRVHWHALPVTAIAYDPKSYHMDPLLYSGGEESVLVTWQIAQGQDRPVQVNPRIALGGIVHIVASERCDDKPASGILVYCEDNSLQLLELHNKGCMWKIQGLACSDADRARISLQIAPRSDEEESPQLLVTGLKETLGFMNWYDPTRERISSSLEVAPFNRVSRNEPDEVPLPKPAITGHAFSKNGRSLITIDENQTENAFIGKHHNAHGVVGTIRFWSLNDNPSTEDNSVAPYYEIASMVYPHGPKNRISALSMSEDGSIACTVSSDEKAFRVWHSSRTSKTRSSTGKKESISWECRYKVQIPSGLSNGATQEKALAFSKDNSLLAIAFGQIGTIWDSERAQLLTTFDNSQGSSKIDVLRFVDIGLHRDLLLIQCKKCVSLGSLHGSSGSFRGWSWVIPQSPRGYIITAVEVIESHECVAIAIYSPLENKSRVVLIDVNTGRRRIDGKEFSIENIDGSVLELCAVQKKRIKSNWGNKDKGAKRDEQPIVLYALTTSNDLLVLTESKQGRSNQIIDWNEDFEFNRPQLHITSTEGNQRKRQRTFIAQQDYLRPKRLALDVFGFGPNGAATFEPSSAELPSLSANFVKTFLGRNLPRIKS